VVMPHDRVLVWGTLAWSAGAVGDSALFDLSTDKVLQAASDDLAAQSLVRAAAGAISIGDWTKAESLATEGRAIAQRRHQTRVDADARAVLARVAIRGDRKDLRPQEATLPVQLTVGMFLRRLAHGSPEGQSPPSG
jgi:hypothetical protein